MSNHFYMYWFLMQFYPLLLYIKNHKYNPVLCSLILLDGSSNTEMNYIAVDIELVIILAHTVLNNLKVKK